MTKIIWSCHDCGTVLPLWVMKCSNCHKSAISWLHIVAGIAVVIPAIFLLLKLL